MYDELTAGLDWNKEKLDIAKNYISHCKSEIVSINSSFLASTSICAILTATATIIASNRQIWAVFYVLPTIYFLAVYNLIKYTSRQVELGKQIIYFENMINMILDYPYLGFEAKYTRDKGYVIWGAVVQLVFFVPFSIIMLYGFWMNPHDNILWSVFFIFMCLQMLVIFGMLIYLYKVYQKR